MESKQHSFFCSNSLVSDANVDILPIIHVNQFKLSIVKTSSCDVQYSICLSVSFIDCKTGWDVFETVVEISYRVETITETYFPPYLNILSHLNSKLFIFSSLPKLLSDFNSKLFIFSSLPKYFK